MQYVLRFFWKTIQNSYFVENLLEASSKPRIIFILLNLDKFEPCDLCKEYSYKKVCTLSKVHKPRKVDFLLFTLHKKVLKYTVFSGPYFPVFSQCTGKYGPERLHIWRFFAQCL